LAADEGRGGLLLRGGADAVACASAPGAWIDSINMLPIAIIAVLIICLLPSAGSLSTSRSKPATPLVPAATPYFTNSISLGRHSFVKKLSRGL